MFLKNIKCFAIWGMWHTCSIMFLFSMFGLKIVPNMWHLVPLVENTQPLEDMGIFELPRTTIKPNLMLFHLYIVILQVFVEQLKVVLYKIQVMTPVITYVKLILLQYNLVLFSTICPMSIADMDHYADLIWVIILTLNLVLWLKSVVFHKIDHW